MVPFASHGRSRHLDWTERLLIDRGHRVERVELPWKNDPGVIVPQMAAYRWVDLAAADRIICFAPPAYLIPHHSKVVWFARGIDAGAPEAGRPAGCGLGRRALLDAIAAAESAALREAVHVFAIDSGAQKYLRDAHDIGSLVLAPPFDEDSPEIDGGERESRTDLDAAGESVCRLLLS